MAGPPPPDWEVDPASAGAREILPGLWRLRIPLAWEQISHVNAYVVEGGELTLVDCGTAGHPTCAEALEVAMRATGHSLDEVGRLLFTHVHSDHMGLAQLVVERSGAEVWSHPNDAHFYEAVNETDRIIAARERRARQEGVPEERLEVYRTADEELEGALGPVTRTHDLTDGVTVSGFTVLETPGHSPSHVCLIRDDVAIVGDLICPAFVPWLDYGYTPDPLAETFASLEALDAIDARLALPGHGRPITEVGATIELTREGFAQRLDATRKAVEQGPAGAYEITTRIWGEEADLPATGHMTEMLSYLRFLRGSGHVTRVTEDDGTYRYRNGGSTWA
ncbi:MBL fold metallo-hydrolase [Solirubrobacter soli]|uniref:MBL fold metallo-hydrolase n=1 Tax=Solirubrobacter soli TaxID=363832 RepID=UPI000413491F|nr:MBL fold metallo-hydrolase [Solirubrobacter soli]